MQSDPEGASYSHSNPIFQKGRLKPQEGTERGPAGLPSKARPVPSPDTAPPPHQDVQALPAVLGVHTVRGRRPGPGWPQDRQAQRLAVLYPLLCLPFVPRLGWGGIGGKERPSTWGPTEEAAPVSSPPNH